MKKLFLSLLIVTQLILCSCGNEPKYKKEYSPDELELYDGYVIIGTTYSEKYNKYCFILKDPANNTQASVEVSKQMFYMYNNLGDTIHSIRVFSRETEPEPTDYTNTEPTVYADTESQVIKAIVEKAIGNDNPSESTKSSFSGIIDDHEGKRIKYIVEVFKVTDDGDELYITAKKITQ